MSTEPATTSPAHTPGGDRPDPLRAPRPWRAVAGKLVVAVVVLAVGVSIGLIAGIHRGPNDASAEAGFARDMQTHHAQAVEMSMIAYRGTGDPELQTMAMDIALTQQAQIGIMRTWLEQWQLSATSSRPAMAWTGDSTGSTQTGGMQNSMPDNTGRPMPGTDRQGLMPGMASAAELDRLRAATGRDLDVLYCTLMIRHHQAGVAMADAILARTDRPQVRALATSIRNGQTQEINAFTTILKRRQVM